MLPTRQEAERILREGGTRNPGPWEGHSRVAAYCAEKIASATPGMDPEKAYILGLLHDIGRRFGTRHLGHVYDGYAYMQSLGYDEAARVCLSHSFNDGQLESYVGNADTTPEETRVIREALQGMVFDDYDRLIQLCDCLAGSDRVMDAEARMADVKRRYGYYPQKKWDINLGLLHAFEEKTGQTLYTLLDREHFRLGDQAAE